MRAPLPPGLFGRVDRSGLSKIARTAAVIVPPLALTAGLQLPLPQILMASTALAACSNTGSGSNVTAVDCVTPGTDPGHSVTTNRSLAVTIHTGAQVDNASGIGLDFTVNTGFKSFSFSMIDPDSEVIGHNGDGMSVTETGFGSTIAIGTPLAPVEGTFNAHTGNALDLLVQSGGIPGSDVVTVNLGEQSLLKATGTGDSIFGVPTSGAGLVVLNTGATGNISANLAGQIRATNDGVYASQGLVGTGSIAITATDTSIIGTKGNPTGGNGIVTTGLLGSSKVSNSGVIWADEAGISSTMGGKVEVYNDGNVHADSVGIFATSTGAALSGSKDVTVGGVLGDYGKVVVENGPGVVAASLNPFGSSDVTVDTGDVTSGSGSLASIGGVTISGGVLAGSLGKGAVTVTTHGKTSTSGEYGAAAFSLLGSATTNILGDVKGNDGTKPSIGGAALVFAGNGGATVNVDPNVDVKAQDVGLFASTLGGGDVNINADDTSKVTSDALGIVGLGTGDGDVTVDAGQVHVKGGSYAIDALGIPLSGGVLGASLGDGAVTVNVNGEITADPGTLFGAFAYSAEGSATLNVNATIDPAIIGGGAITGGSGPANANYNSLVQGTLIGLLAGNLGTGDVNVNLGVPGSIQTDGIGILAFKVGDGNVGVRVNGAIGGLTNPAGPTGDDGVNVDYGFGDGNIRVHSGQYGTINAGDDGVEVNRLGGEGDIRVSLNADVTAKDNGVSILNIGTEGLTKVNIGRKDPMTIDAKNGDGIHILNFGTDGDTKVTVHGGSKVIAKDGSAIGIVSTSLGLGGDHDVIVKNDGLLVGKGGLFSPTVGVITDTDFDFTNRSDGRITTAGHDPSASIFGTLAGGDIDIANYGSMRGSMQLASLFGAIDITNDHRWTTSGFNEFAALCDILIENNDLIRTKGLTVFHFDSLLGQSTVANNDVLKVRDDGSTPGVVFFKGLDEFDNGYGVIDMQNGKSEYAGNPFHVMPAYGTGIGNAVFMSGNFDGGAYSSLYVDTALRGPSDSSSDLLVVKTINQGAYGGGSTTLYVNDTAWNLPGEYVPDGIPVVGVLDGTTTNIGDFTLAGGPIDKGLFTYDLFLDKTPLFQPTSNAAAWVLASYPDSSATALAQSLNIINNMWDTTAGGWIDRSGDLRGIYGTGGGGGSDLALPGASKTSDNANGVWARAIGNWGSRNDSLTIQPFANQPITVAADYDESLWAIQGGADHAFQAGRGTVVVGLMGGYEANSVDFSSPGDSASYTAPMAGIYASYIDGPAYVDALFKADFLKADLNIGGDTASTDGTALGGRIETGYRYKMKGGWFFEPTASLSYVNTELDSTTLSGTPVTFNDADSLRGEIGFRSGGAFASGNLLYQPYLTASLGNEFLGDNSVFLASGPGATVADDVRGLYGKAGAGINVTNLRHNVTTYLQGTYMFSDDYQSGSAKGGIRINW